MQEDLLQFIWKSGLYNNHQLTDLRKNKIEIIHPGFQNQDSGPDFLNAKIRIDGTLWAGNVEIHVKDQYWYNHQHHLDPAYNNVILHVCLTASEEVKTLEGSSVPTISLENRIPEHLLRKYESMLASHQVIPCENLLKETNRLDWFQNIDAMLAERLQNRCDQILLESEHLKADWDELFYRYLCQGLGQKVNAEPMKMLATVIPYRILQKHRGNPFQIEALLFGVSGLLNGAFKDTYPKSLKKEFRLLSHKYGLQTMDAGIWKFMRMRPASFPSLRIAQLASLADADRGIFRALLEVEDLSEIVSIFNVSTSSYWQQHYRFQQPSTFKTGTLGEQSIYAILINSAIPVIFAYGKYRNNDVLCEKAIRWLEKIPPEKNRITNKWNALGVPCENALHSQGLLQVYNKYCNFKRCLNCGIGRKLLIK